MRRLLLSRWNALLLIIAVAAFLILASRLPSNPREGWSAVGVLLNGYHRGAPPGTPFLYGSFQAFVHVDGESLAAFEPAEHFRRQAPEHVLAVATYRVERLRRGVFHPTRQTMTRVITFHGRPPGTTLTARQESQAVEALIEMHRRLASEYPDSWGNYSLDLPAQLQLYADGEVTTGPNPIPGALAANLPFYALITLILATIPGSLLAISTASRRTAVLLRRRADHRPRCPGCAYDLVGLTASRCPECGHALTSLTQSDR